MEYLLEIILKLYLMTVGLSAGVKLLKDNIAKNKILKQGYEIKDDSRDLKTIIIDYIKEYIYILKPIKNLKITKNILFENNKKYTRKMLENLKNNGRIVVQEEKIEQEIKEEKIELKQEKTKQNKQEDISSYIKEIESSKDMFFLNEVKLTFRSKAKQLRERYPVLVDLHKNTQDKNKKLEIKNELENLCKRVKLYDQIYVTARNRIVELHTSKPNIKQRQNAL